MRSWPLGRLTAWERGSSNRSQNRSNLESSFNSSLKVDFQGPALLPMLLVRELDERLGLSALIAANVMDDLKGLILFLTHWAEPP
jgi:hypothetical protein